MVCSASRGDTRPTIPDAGRNASSTVLFSAAMPHSRPNSSQGIMPSRSSMVSASQKITASNNADRLVSHTQRVHHDIDIGQKSPSPGGPTATFSEKIRRAIRKIGMQVSAEEKAVDGEQDKGGRSRINAKDVKHACGQVWIKRRFPCGGSCRCAERVAESVS